MDNRRDEVGTAVVHKPLSKVRSGNKEKSLLYISM